MITLSNIDEFKEHYARAKKIHMDSFQFEGNFVLVSYAKYVIEVFNNATR